MVQLLRGGALDAEFDEGWRTYVKMLDQEVEVEDREPITVHAGSTLSILRLNDGRTYSAGNGPEIETCSDDILEIDAPIAPGEPVYFKWRIYVSGSHEQNYAVCVHTPTNPTGGFQVRGKSVFGSYTGGAFGADSFNTPAGIFAGGVEGTPLLSVNEITVEGMLGCGYQPGRLVLQLAPAEESVGNAFATWEIDIVLGYGALPVLAPGGSTDLTFGLNEKTYTLRVTRSMAGVYTDTWINDPVGDPPLGYTGRVTGTKESQGYRWWYSVQQAVGQFRPAHVEDQGEGLEWISDEPRATLEAALNAVATRLVIDHGNWDLAASNTPGTPYNGRNIGAVIAANKYSGPGVGVWLDSLTRLTQARVYPIDDMPLDEFIT